MNLDNQKIYVLDTSVILHNYNVLKEKRISIIPRCVLDDIKDFQEAQGDVGDNARNASYWLSKQLEQMEYGNEINKDDYKIIFWKANDKRGHDEKILHVASEVKNCGQFNDYDVVILTKSISLRVKAKCNNILSEDYDDVGLIQTIDGWRPLELTVDEMEMISSLNSQQKTFHIERKLNLAINEYVHCTFNGQFCNGMIYRHLRDGWFEKLDMKPHLASIVPKSPEQIMIANSLVNQDIPLVSMIGRAGSGKTLLAIAAGIQQVLIKHEYRKLIITRPIMPVGKDLGYLPGDVNEKMAEWVRPFMNNIEYIMDTNSVKGKNKIATGKVGALLKPEDCKDFFEILPITYIRGSSISDAFIIVDEAQNSTPSEMKTIITRVGQGSKLVLTGDVDQIDNRFLSRECNGLTMAIKKFWNHDLYSHITLKNVERSKLADLATKLLF